jgi:hypothetical protein
MGDMAHFVLNRCHTSYSSIGFVRPNGSEHFDPPERLIAWFMRTAAAPKSATRDEGTVDVTKPLKYGVPVSRAWDA